MPKKKEVVQYLTTTFTVSEKPYWCHVRNIVEHLDHEGAPIFQAELWMNDQLVGTYVEDDWGGPVRWFIANQGLFDVFKDYAATQPPMYFMDMPLEMDADLFMAHLMGKQELYSELTVLIATQTIYRTSDMGEGFWTINAPLTSSLRDSINAEHGVDLIFANDDLPTFIDQMMASEFQPQI